MSDTFAPDWTVLSEWMRTGDCVAAVWEETDRTQDPLIGFATYDHTWDGVFLRNVANVENAQYGARCLPKAITNAKADKPFHAWRGWSPTFIPRHRIKKICFYDPVVWGPWLKG